MNEIMSNVATMSSREIAKLTGKDHGHVMRDIRKLQDQVGDMFAGSIQSWIHPQNGQSYDEYLLDKDTCLTLLLGYDAVARMKVVKRWQELEVQQKPQTALEIIQAQTAILIEQERKLAEHDDRLKRIEAKQQAFEEGVSYFTVLGYASYKGINVDLSTAQQIGQSATKISKDKGFLIDKVRDPRFGMVNSYHESVLDECIAGLL